jgi:hypothetical protein
LSGEVLKDDDESMSNKFLEVAVDALTTNHDEKSSQPKKTPSGASGASKRKSYTSASSSKASTPTKCRKMLSEHGKTPKARAERDAKTYSEHSDSEPSDQDDDQRKPAAVSQTSPRQLLLPVVLAVREDDNSKEEDLEVEPPQQGDIAQLLAKLWAVLIKTEEQIVRAERQVGAISKTRITDNFLEGQVRTWTKETLWKMCKFITNDQTMHQVMQKASKHFKVPALEHAHWMSLFAHIVRDGVNQKRNACSQDLRKRVKSKCGELH